MDPNDITQNVCDANTDHAALKALLSTKGPKGRIARWILDIWSYEFTIFHRKGTENADADALSRIVIPNTAKRLNAQDVLTHEDLIKEQKDDSTLETVLNADIQYQYMIKNGVLTYIKSNLPVVAISMAWRQDFIKRLHEYPTSGHLGRDKTLTKAKKNGYWTNMDKDIKEFVKNCQQCQRFKVKTHKYQQLKSIEVSGPGER